MKGKGKCVKGRSPFPKKQKSHDVRKASHYTPPSKRQRKKSVRGRALLGRLQGPHPRAHSHSYARTTFLLRRHGSRMKRASERDERLKGEGRGTRESEGEHKMHTHKNEHSRYRGGWEASRVFLVGLFGARRAGCALMSVLTPATLEEMAVCRTHAGKSNLGGLAIHPHHSTGRHTDIHTTMPLTAPRTYAATRPSFLLLREGMRGERCIQCGRSLLFFEDVLNGGKGVGVGGQEHTSRCVLERIS